MKKILFFLIFFIHLHINYDDGRFMIFHFQEVQAQVMQREDGYYVCWDEELHESYVSSVSTCDVDVEKYKCSKCSSTFDTESERDSHQNDCNGGGYRCGYCNKECSDPSARDDHQSNCPRKPSGNDQTPSNTGSQTTGPNTNPSGPSTGNTTTGNTGTTSPVKNETNEKNETTEKKLKAKEKVDIYERDKNGNKVQVPRKNKDGTVKKDKNGKTVMKDKVRNCMNIAKDYMKQYGLTSFGSSDKAFVFASGDFKNYTSHPDNMENGWNSIKSHIDNDRPIIGGVDEKKGSGNNDGLTDHWVAITGYGVDENGNRYVEYFETGTNNNQTDNRNRLTYDPSTDTYHGTAENRNPKYEYTLTQVRPNNGNTNGTQPDDTYNK